MYGLIKKLGVYYCDVMSKRVPHTFFDRSAEIVAKDLLGCVLCIQRNSTITRYIIHETEAYVGPEDLASHASKGKTQRTEVMFRKAGTIYVYLIYGMYNMLNFVTGKKEYPAAVLIRGVGPYYGPGKLTKALRIDRAYNGLMLGRKNGIWVEEKTNPVKESAITTTPRIGVGYAKEWALKKLRYILDDTNI